MKMEAGESEFVKIKSISWLHQYNSDSCKPREDDLLKRTGLDRLGCGPARWSKSNYLALNTAILEVRENCAGYRECRTIPAQGPIKTRRTEVKTT
jgi:hypothetical protein